MKTRTAETSQQKNFQFKSIKIPHLIKIEIINFPQIICLTLKPKKKLKKNQGLCFKVFSKSRSLAEYFNSFSEQSIIKTMIFL